MKIMYSSSTKFLGILSGILVLAFSSGCQKDGFDSGSALLPQSFSSTQISGKINNYIVITKSETLPPGFEKKLSVYGEIISSMPEIGEIVIKPTSSNFETKVLKLAEVQAVVPDLVVKWIDPDEFSAEADPSSIGDDETFFKYQWGLDAINAPEAWNAGFTGQGARVFILDNGIDANNPDLIPNLNTELSTSFVPDENFYVRDGRFFNHGTHVAGIIAAADNKWGVIGVAPNAEIVAVKVLSEYTGSGSFSWINAGIVYAANNGADVINMSLGGIFFKNGLYYDDQDVLQKVPAIYIQSFILANKRAVDYAFKKGAVIVAAAGNEASNYDGNGPVFTMPAEQENVIAVSATAPECWGLPPNPVIDLIASYSNYGYSLVKIAAPGGDFDCGPYDRVLSTGAGPLPGTNTWSFYWSAGTSMASPQVAGVAALIIGKNGGEMDPHEVTKQLFKTADMIDGQEMSIFYGNGRVNAFRAVME